MAWWVLVQLGIVAIQLAYAYYTRPHEEILRSATLNDFSFPRAEEGDAVALAYGTVRVDAPTCIWFALLNAEAINPDGVTVGYDYLVSIRLLLCRSNARVDDPNTQHPTLVQMFIGDQIATMTGPGAIAANFGADDTAGNTSFHLEGPSGDNTDGKTHGYAIFYDGRWDGERNLPNEALFLANGDPSIVPYRGYVTMFMRLHVQAPQMAPYSPVIFNPCRIPGHESSTGAIGSGDVNPVAILFDLLTNHWGAIGCDVSLIDLPSFAAAAEVLKDEGFGMSLLVTNPNEARTVIEEVLRTVDGTLYWDPNTGKYVLKLIREDYDPDDLPEFTVANAKNPEKNSTLWSDTYNEVKVIFTERSSGHRPSTATAQDLAGIMINEGRIRSVEVRYPGVRDPDLANRLANRDLNLLCRPIDSLSIMVSRAGWNLKPGDPFRFTWSAWGYTAIFRVVELDFGALEDGAIRVIAVQDRFSIVGNVWDPPVVGTVEDPPATPTPIIHRLVTESPRWIQQQAWDNGQINNVDAQRGYDLAAPEGADSRYRVDSSFDGAAEQEDLPPRAFPVTFGLSTSYARETDPYDTTIGLNVENIAGGSFTSATADQIRTLGRNLIALWDDDGRHEVLSYEAAADLGGGTFQLQNVSRGLLDTVPQTWPGGTRGAVLPGDAGVSAMGRRVIRHGTAVVAHTPAASGSTWTPADASPVDSFTARSRVRLPARGVSLLLNASQTPADLDEDGVTFNWKDRNATSATITRGDATDETVESGQHYDAVGYKGGLPGDADQVVIFEDLISHTAPLALGKVGHGDLELGVDTWRSVLLPDGSTPILRGWQVPTFGIRAHHWRNLLLNPRFAAGSAASWSHGGTATVASATPLGNNGYYIKGATAAGTATITQTVDVSGYDPAGMTAHLSFYCRLLMDSVPPSDEVTVTLYQLDAALDDLGGSTSFGPSSPTSWSRQELQITSLSAGCVYLHVEIVLTANGVGPGPDSTADAGVTELCLRVGQMSTTELLTNGSFEASGGSTTGWTAVSGTWQVLGGSSYEGSYYARPNDGASAELAQTVSIGPGYQFGVAILECARSNDDVDDTGEVVLEALDGGGSVVATTTTGADDFGVGTWLRSRLTIDPIPVDATHLRVRLLATRVTGTPLNAIFDDFSLRCHKHLDPDAELELAWDAPVAQPLPRSAMAWKFAFPDVTPPTYALYDGAPQGKLGIEPLLQTTGAGAVMMATAVHYDGVSHTTTAFEADGTMGTYIETSPTGTAFANFASSDSFTVVVAWKVRPGASIADGFGVCGRMKDGIGWELRITDTDGFAYARVTGDGGAAAATGSTPTADGSLHMAALIYNGSTQEITLVDAGGVMTSDASGIGELRGGPGKLRIHYASESEAAELAGQVLRVYIWREALDTADIGTIFQYKQSDPSGLITSDGRTGSIAAVTASAATGVLVEIFGPGRTAIAYDTAVSRYGLVTMPAMDELVHGATGVVDTGTVEDRAAVDPTGFRLAIRIEGDDTEGRAYTEIDPGGPATLYVSFMARADASHFMSVWLDAVGGSAEDNETIAIGTTWAVYTVELAWTDSGGNGLGNLRFAASGDGTTREIYLSSTICASVTKPYPGTFPIASPGPTLPVLDVSALTQQVNHEGELAVEAAFVNVDSTIASLWNGTNDNDRRTIRWDADPTTPRIKSDHCNGSGTANTNAQIATAFDPTDPTLYRLRWNRASTLDGTVWITSLRAEQGVTVEADQGRNTSWTPSTTPVDELDLGHENGSGGAAGLVYSVTVRTREEKL